MHSKKLCVIGGGIAGLAFTYRLEQLNPLIEITLFEKKNRVGGRLMTTRNQKFVSDIGANYITWDLLQRPNETEEVIRQLLGQNCVDIKAPLYLYDKQKGFRLGDHQSSKVAHRNGIQSLAQDIAKKIKSQIKLGTQIQRIKRIEDKWKVNTKQEQFDFNAVVIAVPFPQFPLFEYPSSSELQKIPYTDQISASFELLGAVPYSCVLFKNHPITFVCCQQEKCKSPTVCIQMDQVFSKQHWDESNEDIQQSIKAVIPAELNIQIGQIKSVAKWSPSLLQKAGTLKNNYQQHFYFIGDSTLQKSRVASSFESGYIKAEELANIFKSQARFPTKL